MIADISKYQNKIDWDKVKTSKLEGVYIKATEGVGYIDPLFKSHVIGASSINLSIGFYHFATLNSTNVIADSTNEAKDFFNAVKGITTKLAYVLDIEENEKYLDADGKEVPKKDAFVNGGLKFGLKKVPRLTPDEVLKWIQNFVLTLHVSGINDVMLYSYSPFLDANLPKGHNLGLVLPLWIAAYAPAYKVPNGWQKADYWQYTQKGIVDGINGNVDLSKKV